MLSDHAIKKYIKIYRKQFDVEISREEAAEQAQRLLNLARIVCQPMPKRWEARYRELLAEAEQDEGQSLDGRHVGVPAPAGGLSKPMQTVEERLSAGPLEK